MVDNPSLGECNTLRESPKTIVNARKRMPQSAREGDAKLTPREVAVMHLVAKGLRNKEIGEKLLIGEGTVKIHLNRIYTKLKLKNRVALALYVRYRDMF